MAAARLHVVVDLMASPGCTVLVSASVITERPHRKSAIMTDTLAPPASRTKGPIVWMDMDTKLPMRVESNGDLVAQLESGAVRFHKPVVYQTSGQDRKTFVDGAAALWAGGVGCCLTKHPYSTDLSLPGLIRQSII